MTRQSIGRTIKRRRLAAAGARYSNFVGLMKVLLPTGAAVLTVLVVAWPFLSGRDEGMPISFADVAPTGPGTPLMSNARYFGTDKDNRPFSVTADTVTQVDDDEDTVHFTAPKADMLLASGAWVALTADRGTLHRAANIMELEGAVSIFSDEGYEFHTERAEIDIDANIAWGDWPIEGQGPLGILNADSFRLNNATGRLLFEGRVRMTVYPNVDS
jgi:lipopolysaccharide export system protein LptC